MLLMLNGGEVLTGKGQLNLCNDNPDGFMRDKIDS